MPRTFLTASWRKLIMAQYEVDPAILTAWLPPGVALDLYQDKCYVSLVGFLFDAVRVLRCAVPFHTRFPEVNLRFYATRTEADGTRKRGVIFVSEIVPRAAISLIANRLYEEPYRTMRMLHVIDERSDSLHVSYRWKDRQRWQSVAVEASPVAEPIAPGSIEEFITEHYWGYTKRTRGQTSEYAVKHPRWKTYPIRDFKIDADFGALYGRAFAGIDVQQPASILLAEGSAVSVSTGSRLIG